MFEQHSKTIIGLERLMLEASGFDFRNRYPQKLLLKIARHHLVDQEMVGKTAYNMSLDLYRTFAPLKQTAATMAVSCVELAGRVLDQNLQELEAQKGYEHFCITRAEVMGESLERACFLLDLIYRLETLLDLLDLYTHHRTSTIVGQDHALEKFISIRITLNQEASANKILRHTQTKRKLAVNGVKLTNGTKDAKSKKIVNFPPSSGDVVMTNATATATNGASLSKPGLKDGTVRFMLDPQRAKEEKDTVSEFFNLEEEEYEVEVPIERPAERERRRP